MAAFDDPVSGWHSEHAYFGRLLDLLQQELERLRRGRKANYEVMLDVVEYLHVYGDRYHHAREEAAFSFLAFHRPDLRERLNRLGEEHIALAWVGERLLDELNDAVEGFASTLDDLQALTGTYLILYREHIANEEVDIVSAADVLTEDDWSSVSQAMPPRADPLFGVTPERRYQELLKSLEL